jgi:ABC-type cobalamin/Fe3+-siderophores transport system ATPase subunit
MVKKVTPAGLSYKKLDLHIHTPKSHCFSGDCTPEQLVEKAIEKGLDGIAITDHNTGEWIDLVKVAARNKPLTVFPGVEITCTGGSKNIHIIALLDPSAGTREVETILHILKIQSKAFGQQDAVTDFSPIEVIDVIHENGGLAVLAHANSSHGVMKDMSGEPRTRIIQCPLLHAVEATDFEDSGKTRTRKRVVDYLDGTDPTYQRKLAVFQASDNPTSDGSGQHSLEGIGTRYSCFKVESLNLESLRQCFIDPETRIKLPNQLPLSAYPQIRKVAINSGFLTGEEACFHSGLTSILGAKGAGKSLLIEFMRFALNQEPKNSTIRQDHKSKLARKLGEYGTVEVTFVDENGKETKIARTLRELDESPYDISVPYDPAQIFPVLFLSQNEIIAIAENEEEQLEFIDRFFDFYTYRSRITAIEKELKRLDRTMAEGLRAFSEYEGLMSKFQTVEKEIAKLDEALKDPIFEKFQELERKGKALRNQQVYLGTVVDNIGKAKEMILARTVPEIPESLKNDPALQRILALIAKAKNTVDENLIGLSKNLTQLNQTAEKEYLDWKPLFDVGKKQYEELIQKMGGDYKAIAMSRQNFVRQLTDLQRQLDTVGAKKDQVKPISKQRDDLLDELQKEYAAYTEERKAKCEKFMRDSKGKLRLRILDQSNAQRFSDSLLSLKRGSYLRDDEIITITSKINPRDFMISMLRYVATKESKFLVKVSEESGIELKRMKILADYLLSAIPYEDLLSLQYKAQPQDRPEILFDTGEGNYQPLSNMSVGQKCTAMLLMALSDGTMPIVIDQPEDSLDIRSIWEDVCMKLRTGKEKRQFIFTTHNSSLAVASDTDCYLILEAEATHGKIARAGSMDHSPLGDEVVKYLEGGRGTYSLKYEKYGGIKNHEYHK